MTLQEQFDALTLQDLEDFITNKQVEHLQLDFKTVKGSSLNSSDDKSSLAVALSGFANSSGGLIIWGVDARKNADKIDCADSKKEIENLPLFLSRLNALTGEAANPLIDGVKHRGIFTNSDRGFAVTIVPESETTPHMAKCGQQRYYKRSGDAFYQMEHFDLEDMFGRRKKPNLMVKAIADYRTRISIHGFYSVQLNIENEGRGIAKSPYLSLTLPADSFEVAKDSNLKPIHEPQNFTNGKAMLVKHTFASTTLVIHPGTTLNAIRLVINEEKHNLLEPIVINYEITAEDISLSKGTSHLTYKTRVFKPPK